MTVFRPPHSGRCTVQKNIGHFGSHGQPCDRPYYTTTNAGWSAVPTIYRTALHSAHNTIQNVFWWFRHRQESCGLPSVKMMTTSNGSWCIGIKGEMSGTVCVTFTWDIYIYIYIWVVYSFCLFCCLFIIVTWWYIWCIVWQVASKRKYRHVW